MGKAVVVGRQVDGLLATVVCCQLVKSLDRISVPLTDELNVNHTVIWLRLRENTPESKIFYFAALSISESASQVRKTILQKSRCRARSYACPLQASD